MKIPFYIWHILSDTELRCHVFHKYKRHYVLSYHCQFLFQSLIEMAFSSVTHPILELLTTSIFVVVLLSLTWSVHRIPQPSYGPFLQIYHAEQEKKHNYIMESFFFFTVFYLTHCSWFHTVQSSTCFLLDFSHILLTNKTVFLCRGKTPNSKHHK